MSQHLLVLKNAGTTGEEKRGKKLFSRLLMPCVAEIVLCFHQGESTLRAYELAPNFPKNPFWTGSNPLPIFRALPPTIP